MGVLNSSVNGDHGNDTISISGSTFDIEDALIYGGSGNDTLDIGTGSGTVDGGSGYDVLAMDFFDAATMVFDQLDNHQFQITGTQDKQGNLASWTQTLVNIEAVQVDGTTLAIADYVA